MVVKQLALSYHYYKKKQCKNQPEIDGHAASGSMLNYILGQSTLLESPGVDQDARFAQADPFGAMYSKSAQVFLSLGW